MWTWLPLPGPHPDLPNPSPAFTWPLHVPIGQLYDVVTFGLSSSNFHSPGLTPHAPAGPARPFGSGLLSPRPPTSLPQPGPGLRWLSSLFPVLSWVLRSSFKLFPTPRTRERPIWSSGRRCSSATWAPKSVNPGAEQT